MLPAFHPRCCIELSNGPHKSNKENVLAPLAADGWLEAVHEKRRSADLSNEAMRSSDGSALTQNPIHISLVWRTPQSIRATSYYF
jgi:hypothetical protein